MTPPPPPSSCRLVYPTKLPLDSFLVPNDVTGLDPHQQYQVTICLGEPQHGPGAYTRHLNTFLNEIPKHKLLGHWGPGVSSADMLENSVGI